MFVIQNVSVLFCSILLKSMGFCPGKGLHQGGAYVRFQHRYNSIIAIMMHISAGFILCVVL